LTAGDDDDDGDNAFVSFAGI